MTRVDFSNSAPSEVTVKPLVFKGTRLMNVKTVATFLRYPIVRADI
jgi:hypothetical protein